jgi:hypothetical protein
VIVFIIESSKGRGNILKCHPATYRRIRVAAKAATTSFTSHPRE